MNRIPSDHDSYLSKTLYSVTPILRSIVKRGLRRKLLCLILILNLLIWQAPSLAFQQAPALASVAFNLTTGSVRQLTALLKLLVSFVVSQRQPDTLTDRINAVSRIQITPFKLVGYEGQSVNFTALPVDAAGGTVQGVRFTWESSDPNKVRVDETGQATFLGPGLARIICRAGAARASAPVLIRPGHRPPQSDAQFRLDQASLTRHNAALSVGTTSNGLIDSTAHKIAPTVSAQSLGQIAGYAGTDYSFDELWSEPRNLVGSPRNRVVEPTRIGSVLPEGSNHSFALPIINLRGRGLSANLVLYYNSRVWARHGNSIAFDPVASWPAPGFSLGFGRIITYGPSNSIKYLLIAPDGTRHYLGQGGSASQTVTLRTSDGSQITYSGNATVGGTLYYPDGTKADITISNNRLVPTRITDTDGNYITISYGGVKCDTRCIVEDCLWDCPLYMPPLAINQVTDTLGRIIQFTFDENYNRLIVNGGGAITYFVLEMRNISGNFSGLTVENRPSGAYFLKRVYFSNTGMGHLYTYSDFGMVTKVSVRRQMHWTQGQPTDGVESVAVTYNYPVSGASALTDAPAFTQRTETSGGTFSYSTSEDTIAQTKTFIISVPDATAQQPTQSEARLTRSTNPASAGNGLRVQCEIKRGSTSHARSVYAYSLDAGGSPQVQSITSYNEAGAATREDFDYDQYGNVLNRREYGSQINGSWQVRRRTRFTYKTEQAYINEHLRSLVTQVELLDARENTFDADDLIIAKKVHSYDDYMALGGMENYGGLASPPGHLLNFNETKTVRGNLTGTTEWVDIAANISITSLSKYDIFGNIVKAQLSCCNERSFLFTQASYWSQPEQESNGTQGSALTSSATYDFNTNVVTSQTNVAGLTTTYGYDNAGRNTSVTLPTGASGSVNYNDATLTTTNTLSYYDAESGFQDPALLRVITTSSVRDGWGHTVQEVNQHGGQVNTTFDAMGRVQSRTNPFPQAGQPGPVTSYEYDALGRVTKVTLPGGNTLETTYDNNTATVKDQVGRKTRRETDGLGRLVKITEQEAGGLLTQETAYSYNLLDKLERVNQGGQIRKYKYDAVGRLLYEHIPEQAATIDDGTGNLWSMKYTYTEHGSVASREDSRGVVTTYSYDNLRRPTGISYDTTNAPAVAATPNLTYSYVDSGNGKGQVQSVSVGSVYQESNTFDQYDRVILVAHTINGRTYTTSHSYNQANQPKRIAHMYPEYDLTGRLFALRDSNSAFLLSDASYNIVGQATGDRIIANGQINESFTYDSQRMQLNTHTVTKGGITLMNLTYGFQAQMGEMGAGTHAGNAGQLMSVSGTIGGQIESAVYRYDLIGRLATSSQTTNGASAQRRYEYDRWANRTGAWDAIAGGNQIQSVVLQQAGGAPTNRISSVTTSGITRSYSYDAAGNVTNDGQHTYIYDAENRVVSVDEGAVGQYAYDQQNRRIKKVVGSGITHYLWEGGNVIAEYNGITGTQQVTYYYAGSRLIAKDVGGQRRYFLSDRLNVRLVLDTSGSIIGRQGHLPYGEEIALAGEQDKHQFTSYEKDPETNLDYAINRYDDVRLGRFRSVDPVTISASKESPQSWNRYTYTANDPINNIDPAGLLLQLPPPVLKPCDPFGPVVLIDGFAFYGNICFRWPLTAPTVDPGPEPGPPQPCKINVRTHGKANAKVSTKGRDNSEEWDTLGPKENLGWWFFFFEVDITLPGDAQNFDDWVVNQSLVRTGWVSVIVNGKEEIIPDQEASPEDGPEQEYRDTSKRGVFTYIDYPGRNKSSKGSDKLNNQVVNGEIFWDFNITYINKRDLRRSCSTQFRLTLRISNGQASWTHRE